MTRSCSINCRKTALKAKLIVDVTATCLFGKPSVTCDAIATSQTDFALRLTVTTAATDLTRKITF